MNKQKMVRNAMILVLVSLMVLGSVATAAAKIPVLRFIEPDAGDTVSNKVQVLVFSPAGEFTPDGSSLPKEVRLVVDQQIPQTMTNLGNMLYTIGWDSTSVANGKHTLTAVEILWTTPPSVNAVTIEITVQNSSILPDGTSIGTRTGALEVAVADSAGLVYQTDPFEPAPDPGPAPLPDPTADPGQVPVPTPLPPPMPPPPPDPGQLK